MRLGREAVARALRAHQCDGRARLRRLPAALALRLRAARTYRCSAFASSGQLSRAE